MYTEESKVSPWPLIKKYTIIGGLLIIIYALAGNLLGVSSPNASTFVKIFGMLINIGIFAYVLIMPVKQHRDEDLGGYISFGRAFKICFNIALIITIISAVFTYIYVQFIDPGMIKAIYDATIAEMQKSGSTDQQIESMQPMLEMMNNPVAFTVISFLSGLFWGCVCGLIVSAVFQKKPLTPSL